MSSRRPRPRAHREERSVWELKRERAMPEDDAFTLRIPGGRRAARALKLPEAFLERLKAFDTPVTEETWNRLVTPTCPDEAPPRRRSTRLA